MSGERGRGLLTFQTQQSSDFLVFVFSATGCIHQCLHTTVSMPRVLDSSRD